MSDLGDLEASSEFNHTNGSAPSDCGRINKPARVFFLLVYTLVFLAGLLLNGFTLKVYYCRTGRQQRGSDIVTVYLKNLAAADFLVSLCLPVRIANYAAGSVSVRWVYCTFGASAFYLNMYASILFMGYIAANRYLKIVHPTGSHFLQTVRAAHSVAVATWLLLLAPVGVYVVLALLTEEQPASPPASPICDMLHGVALRLLYKVVHSFSAALFLLVLVSLVFFYCGVSRRLAASQQRQPASSGSKKLAKSRRNLLVLVGVFCFCFVPYHLVRLPYAFLGGRCCCSSQVFFYLKELTVMVSILSVCLDPLIYFLFCKAFRAQLSPGRRPSSTQGATGERRSSDPRVNGGRRSSLATSTKHMSVL
ncbi:P2Y purinoceptor 14-like [Pungitius pungitius]|uniref:P2Y purinoceptor 14-like n=1 Tax=Pungitius pungitius TaxID=134920 RepID=UPI0018877B27|nr:P2Y purinoceptor 14-like [Pungitius pungitius]